MADTVLPTHEALLRLCAAAAPAPWYPKVYAQTSGVPRDSLDAPLNELRVSGLVRLTEWVKGVGQGYALTELGEQVLRNPVLLAQLRSGGAPPTPVQAGAPAPAEEPPAAGEPTTYERGEKARAALYEPEPPRVMPVLLLLNLLAFAISFAVAVRGGVPIHQFIGQGDIKTLHEVGALSSVDLLRGEWWRLLTCTFLHFGLLHLFVNMYSLYVLGLLESLWGSARYLFLYLVSALGGSCAVVLYNPGAPGEITLVAGASGAIWGLMLSLIAWVFMNRRHLPPQEVSRWFNRFGILLLINVGISLLPGVSAAAHFGGGAVGFITATLLHVQRVAAAPRRGVAVALLALLPVILVAAVAEAMEKDARWQRLAQAFHVRDVKRANDAFRTEAIPAVAKADEEVETLLTPAYVLTDMDPKKRDKPRVEAMRDVIKAGRNQVRNALEKLHDRPSGDEKLESAYLASKEYMETLAELLDHFDDLLANGGRWDKDERVPAESKRRKARVNWVAVRNQL
jgi:rhomboid protease GluP